MLLSVAVFCYMKLFSTVVCCTLLCLHSADSTESFSSHSLHRSACTLGCTELYVLSSLCLTLSVSCCCRFVPYWIQPPHWSHVDPHCASFHSGVDVVLGYSTLSCTLPTFTVHHIYSETVSCCISCACAGRHSVRRVRCDTSKYPQRNPKPQVTRTLTTMAPSCQSAFVDGQTALERAGRCRVELWRVQGSKLL